MEWARELTSAILLTANMMLFFLLLYCSDGFIVVFALCSVCNRLSWHSSMILISISFWFGMTEALNDGKTVWILKNAIRRQRRALKFLSQAFLFFFYLHLQTQQLEAKATTTFLCWLLASLSLILKLHPHRRLQLWEMMKKLIFHSPSPLRPPSRLNQLDFFSLTTAKDFRNSFFFHRRREEKKMWKSWEKTSSGAEKTRSRVNNWKNIYFSSDDVNDIHELIRIWNFELFSLLHFFTLFFSHAHVFKDSKSFSASHNNPEEIL